MIRFYLLPIVVHDGKYRGPKYFKWRFGTGIDCLWSMKYYGRVDQAVLAADIDQVDHDALILNSDVFAFPENLENNMIPADRLALRNYLEGMLIPIPGDWLSPSDTYRTALKTVTGMFMFMQRLTSSAVMDSSPETWGVALNTQYKDFSPELQAGILQVVSEFGWDDSVIKDNWTVRVLWKNMADQWGSTPIIFGGFVTI